jgi:hypothetical protein
LRTSRPIATAAELLIAEADVVAFSKAVELGLFYDSRHGMAEKKARPQNA